MLGALRRSWQLWLREPVFESARETVLAYRGRVHTLECELADALVRNAEADTAFKDSVI